MAKMSKKKKMFRKLIGGDKELGNFVTGIERHDGTGALASRITLKEIPGYRADNNSYHLPHHHNTYGTYTSYVYSSSIGWYSMNGRSQESSYNPQDVGRKYLAQGGCAYIDLDHVEICLPEVLSAYDFVKYNEAFHTLAGQARERANASLPEGQHLHVFANNSDGQSNSYGSHLNFLVSRECFDNLFNIKLQYVMYLASFQACSVVITGQGKVGSENGHDHADFQLSQRADFFATVVGPQTTFNRPLVNSRNEPHAREDMCRLHVIFFDNLLCHVANFLTVGMMQIVLAMLEADCINLNLILENPLQALSTWSHDPSLRQTASTLKGASVTAVELQLAFCLDAKTFLSSGRIDDSIVPGAREIVELWHDTLLLLKAQDFERLSTRLDWVLKRRILLGARDEHSLDWNSPGMKHLDLMYSSLDKEEGLYWLYEKAGAVERIVSGEEIEKAVLSPPEDTRAWFRSYLLRKAVRENIEIDKIDWDSMVFVLDDDQHRGYLSSRKVRVSMDNPLGFTKKECASLIKSTSSFHELLTMIGEEVGTSNKAVISIPMRDI
jgi:proteasome accessory factor A